MTDKDKVKQLLDGFSIPYRDVRVEENGRIYSVVSVVVDKTLPEPRTVIGYAYFTTEFEFDADDNFVNMGIWE